MPINTERLVDSVTRGVDRIAVGAVYALATLIPVFFLPVTPDFFDTQKHALLVVFTSIILVSFAVKTFVTKTFRFTVTPVTLPALGLLAAVVLSALLATPYRYEALTGRTLMFVALLCAFILLPSLLKTIRTSMLLICATGGAFVSTLLMVAEQLGYGSTFLLNSVLKIGTGTQGLFHPTGSMLAGALFLVPLGVAHLAEAFRGEIARGTTREETQSSRVTHVALSVFLGISLMLHVFFMLPSKPSHPIFPPFSVSWSIAVDILKNPKTALLGVGPESYLSAFTQFRPPEMNLLRQIWNVRFTTARTELLQVITTLGVLGFVAWVMFALAVVRAALPLSTSTIALTLGIGVLFIEFLLFPANIAQYTQLFLLTISLVMTMKREKDARISDMILHLFAIKLIEPESTPRAEKHLASQILAIGVAVLLFGLVGINGYFYGKIYAADMIFYQSLLATQQNDGAKAYTLQSRVVEMEPFVDRFRRAFASTNFLVADAIARNPQSTREDRNNIPQLIQQSIREAKAATELDPRKTINWETLATIYRALISVAQGADQWTVAAYVRAIQTDPSNPALRIDLGSVYISTQNYEQAIRVFQQATELKPDWANAQYNLSNAYKQKGDDTLSLEALKKTLMLLPANSEEYTKVQQEIANFTIKSKQQTAPTVSSQSSPKAKVSPSPFPKIEGQIRLPKDLGLEASPAPSPAQNP